MNGLVVLSKTIGTPLYARAFESNYGLSVKSQKLSALSLSGLLFTLGVHSADLLQVKGSESNSDEASITFESAPPSDHECKGYKVHEDPEEHVKNVLQSITLSNVELSFSLVGDALTCLLHHPKLLFNSFPQALSSNFNINFAKACKEGVISRGKYRKVVVDELKRSAGHEISLYVNHMVKELQKHWDTNWMYVCYSPKFCAQMDMLLTDHVSKGIIEGVEALPTLSKKDQDEESTWISPHSPSNGLQEQNATRKQRIIRQESNSTNKKLEPNSQTNHLSHEGPFIPRPPEGKPPPKRFQRKTASNQTLRRFSRYITDFIFRRRKQRRNIASNSPQSDYYFSELAGEFQLYYSDSGVFPALDNSKDFEDWLAILYEAARILSLTGDTLSYLEFQYTLSMEMNNSHRETVFRSHPHSESRNINLSTNRTQFWETTSRTRSKSMTSLIKKNVNSHDKGTVERKKKSENATLKRSKSLKKFKKSKNDSLEKLNSQENDISLLQDMLQIPSKTQTKMIFYRFKDVFVFFPVSAISSKFTSAHPNHDEAYIQKPLQPNIRRVIHESLEQLHEFLNCLQLVTKFHYDIQISMPLDGELHENLKNITISDPKIAIYE